MMGIKKCPARRRRLHNCVYGWAKKKSKGITIKHIVVATISCWNQYPAGCINLDAMMKWNRVNHGGTQHMYRTADTIRRI